MERELERGGEDNEHTWIKSHFHAISYLSVDSCWRSIWRRNELIRFLEKNFFDAKRHSSVHSLFALTNAVWRAAIARIQFLARHINKLYLFRVNLTIDWTEAGVAAPSRSQVLVFSATSPHRQKLLLHITHAKFITPILIAGRSRGPSSDSVRQTEIVRCIASHSAPSVTYPTDRFKILTRYSRFESKNRSPTSSGKRRHKHKKMEYEKAIKKISSQFRVFVLAAFACVVFFFLHRIPEW